MLHKLKAAGELLWKAARAWRRDGAPRLGAALSYYTVFALPPLFVIVLFIAGLWLDQNAVRAHMLHEIGGLIGEKSAQTIEAAMTAQEQSRKGVLVSLLISAGLSALGRFVSGLGLFSDVHVFWTIVNSVVSFAVITTLFAMIFKVLPDVKISWSDVWVGATITAFLFTVGKFLLGWYLGRSTIVSAYGAAGSVVLILLWVYYSAQIMFFGAEVTKVYANRYGEKLQPG